jgi:hypothetical protein
MYVSGAKLVIFFENPAIMEFENPSYVKIYYKSCHE